MINAGDLRHRVALQSVTESKDSEGFVGKTYTLQGSIWADIQPIGGDYAQKKYGIDEAGISARMITRVNSLVKQLNIITWDSVDYEIRYVSVFIDRYESLLRPVVK